MASTYGLDLTGLKLPRPAKSQRGDAVTDRFALTAEATVNAPAIVQITQGARRDMLTVLQVTMRWSICLEQERTLPDTQDQLRHHCLNDCEKRSEIHGQMIGKYLRHGETLREREW